VDLGHHDETPYMPPNQDRIADAKLQVLRAWIEGGSLENMGSKVAKKKATSLAVTTTPVGMRPENPAMPTALWKQPVLYTERPSGITALAASPWAPVVAVAGQKQIVMYHSDTGEHLGVLPFPEGEPHVLRFSRDGSVLLAGGGRGAHSGYVALYDVATGKRLVRVGDELDVVLSADVAPDLSQIALAGPQRLIRIYATDTGELLHEIKKHTDWVYAVEYSPDGVLLATSDRANGLFVWEADTARQWLDLRGHNLAVTDVSWRADSNVLASSSMDGTVKLWEMNEGGNIKSWNAHEGGVMSVEYTHDGRLVTAGRDKTVKTWSTEGDAVRTFPAFSEAALLSTFTHDGNRVLGRRLDGRTPSLGSRGRRPGCLAAIQSAHVDDGGRRSASTTGRSQSGSRPGARQPFCRPAAGKSVGSRPEHVARSCPGFRHRRGTGRSGIGNGDANGSPEGGRRNPGRRTFEGPANCLSASS
jgi:hypothetical protein